MIDPAPQGVNGGRESGVAPPLSRGVTVAWWNTRGDFSVPTVVWREAEPLYCAGGAKDRALPAMLPSLAPPDGR